MSSANCNSQVADRVGPSSHWENEEWVGSATLSSVAARIQFPLEIYSGVLSWTTSVALSQHEFYKTYILATSLSLMNYSAMCDVPDNLPTEAKDLFIYTCNVAEKVDDQF